ncbi:MAG: hypothetical protein K8S99_13230 [Planctomycetes bacterium]|nr:hypothetical protein [Planctomycetota bacterium]
MTTPYIKRPIRLRFTALAALSLMTSTALPCAAQPAPAPTNKTVSRVSYGDEAPQARRYMDWVFHCVTRIQENMPAISAAAELAADPYIHGGKLSVQAGTNNGLNEELMSRSGGFCAMDQRETNAAKETPDVVLFALGVTPAGNAKPVDVLTADIDAAAKLKAQGVRVIAIASFEDLNKYKLLDRAKESCDALLDNYAAADDGLFTGTDSRAIVPTCTVANAAVAWTWAAELFAACTRKGYTPVMYRSILLDRKSERFNKYKGLRFHEDLKAKPADPGVLGREYLARLRAVMRDVSTTSWPAIVRTSRAATDTLIGGGNVYVWTLTHYTQYHHGGKLAADPGYFKALNNTYEFLAQPTGNDMVIGLGYCFPPGAPGPYVKDAWGDTRIIRRAGHVAWVISGFLTSDKDLDANEWLVDQRWPEGDAEVKPDGYDIPIFPVSGVVAEAMIWSINAQTAADYQDHLAHVVKKKK